MVIAPKNDPMAIMPVYSIDVAIARRNAILDFTRKVMVQDTDFGAIPGTGKGDKPGKNVLLKPGAEKLVSLFGLTPKFTIVKSVEDWTGADHAGEPFFEYISKCSLYKGDMLIAEGQGSCNSWESKYRYRNAQRECPLCGAAAIQKSKFPPKNAPRATPGFYCYSKIGGCGAEFDSLDSRIVDQDVGKKPNPDIADQQNTFIKMADKRSLIAVCLIGLNASEMFTQDIEDQIIPVAKQQGQPEQHHDVIDADYRDEPAQHQSKTQPSQDVKPKTTEKQRLLIKELSRVTGGDTDKDNALIRVVEILGGFGHEGGITAVKKLSDKQVDEIMIALKDRPTWGATSEPVVEGDIFEGA